MGIPGHMRAYCCSRAYAGIWALGLATCGYEEYGHKWRKAHQQANTNSTSLSFSSLINMIRKKLVHNCPTCFLGLPSTILTTSQFIHIYMWLQPPAKNLKVFDFSREMCSNLWLSGDRFGRFVLPNCFRTISHPQSGADGRSYPPTS